MNKLRRKGGRKMRRTVLTILVLFVVINLNAGTVFAKPKEDTKTVVPLEQWERNERVDKKVYKIADELEKVCIMYKDDPEAIGWSPVAARLVYKLKGFGKDALPAILDIAKDKSRNVELRKIMMSELGFSYNPAVTKPLINFLLDKAEDSSVRYNAADLLGRILKDTTATNALIETMEDKNNPEKVRWEAIRSIGSLQDIRGISYLWETLKNKEEGRDIRAISARALGGMGKAIEPKTDELIEMFNNEEYGLVKDNLICALGATGSKKIIKPLIEYIHRKKFLGNVVSSAILNIGGPEAKEVLQGLLRDESEGIRFDAAKALIKMRDKSVIPEIEKILPTLEVYHRNMVSDSLSKLREMNNK